MAEDSGQDGADSTLRRFLRSEAVGGLLLILAAALALAVANSSLADAYRDLLHAETGPVLSPRLGPMTVHLWINDGLMAAFFLLVGLEIKREFVDGRLAGRRQRRLPVIAAGLFAGKQIGIFGAVWLAVRFGLAARPGGATWLQIYGVSLLCGIGFTMSLFIGMLAFPAQPLLVEEAKIGILLGSLASAIAGFAVLRLAPPAATGGATD